jgi:hypothetical protein
MTSGAPDFTKVVWVKYGFDYTDKMPVYEKAPWAWDSVNDRIKCAIEAITSGVEVDIPDDWTRQLGQIDLARYRGAAPSHTNPLHVRLSDGVSAFIDPRDRNWTITESLARSWTLGDSDVPDLKDRGSRLLGIVYGNKGQLAQRTTSLDLYAALRVAGAEIDPRDRNWTITETVPVSAADLDIRNLVKTQDEVSAVLKTDAGVAYDARDRNWTISETVPVSATDLDIRDLTATERTPLGSQAQALRQRASTYELLVQLANAGVEIDPRSIRALTSADEVTTYPKAGQTWPVSATDLDIRNLAKAQDEVYAVLKTDAGVALDPRDRNWTITETVPVSATDLDIRDLGASDRPNANIEKWGGTSLTGRDISGDLSKLDVALSTKARLQPWYQPNFAMYGQRYSDWAIVPHDFTTRWTYTTPANRIAQICDGYIRFIRVTAATTSGYYDCILGTGSAEVMSITSNNNTAGYTERCNLGWGTLTTAGQTIAGQTHDASTGGTVSYLVTAHIMEFNT